MEGYEVYPYIVCCASVVYCTVQWSTMLVGHHPPAPAPARVHSLPAGWSTPPPCQDHYSVQRRESRQSQIAPIALVSVVSTITISKQRNNLLYWNSFHFAKTMDLKMKIKKKVNTNLTLIPIFMHLQHFYPFTGSDSDKVAKSWRFSGLLNWGTRWCYWLIQLKVDKARYLNLNSLFIIIRKVLVLIGSV